MNKTHIFTVPPPYPQVPVDVFIPKGESPEKWGEMTGGLLSHERFRGLGIFEEKPNGPSGTATILKVPVSARISMITRNEAEYPKEFTEYLTPSQQELVKKLFENIRSGSQYPVVHGGLGDMENCDAVVEERIDSDTEGTVTKFWGNSYLFKSYPLHEWVEGMSFGKSIISAIPREIILNNWIMLFGLAILFLFSKKKFIHYLRVYLNIAYRGIAHLKDKYKPNRPERELRKAMNKALEWEVKKITSHMEPVNLLGMNYHVKYPYLLELYMAVANFMEFLYFFIAHDTAYRFRLQDVVGEIDHENLHKSEKKEILRLLDVLISREDPKHGKYQIKKYRAVKFIAKLILRNKHISRLLREFILNLDISKVRLDEADWYFCLRRQQYNFGGKTLSERLAEANRIDKEKDHLGIQLILLSDQKGGKIPAVKIIQP